MPWYLEPSILHPLSGSDPATFRALYRSNKPYDRRSLVSRWISRAAVQVRRPFVRAETRKHHETILEHSLEVPPVFIVGHWRSGTTFLHNILSRDPRFAPIKFCQTALPWDCLGKLELGKRAMGMLMPKTRGMDNVEVGPDEPQEEEMGLGLMQPYSFFNTFYFPQDARRHFRESILFENVSEAGRETFAARYDYLVRKMSYANGGKRILFKNPASTARLDMLAKRFPGARFVHIARNPYEVHSSMLRLWPALFETFSWQDTSNFDADGLTREFYPLLMERFFAQRETLDDAQVVDVRYEDLKKDPLATVEKVYRQLDMGFERDAREPVERYLGSLAGYKPNSHAIDRDLVDSLRKDWGDVIEKLGY